VAARVITAIFATLALAIFAASANAQQATSSDAEYIANIKKGAPPEVVDQATIIKLASGHQEQTVRAGTNQFTCMVDPTNVPMCMDEAATEWVHAWMGHTNPPDKVGFIYMLRGDSGASNTDPYATEKKSDNHWIETGPHVMIVGPAVKQMQGYPRNPDPDVKAPYVMWAGTPYEHLMLPTTTAQSH
jgi:hypothetical protein